MKYWVSGRVRVPAGHWSQCVQDSKSILDSIANRDVVADADVIGEGWEAALLNLRELISS